jgi:hypothetical protein
VSLNPRRVELIRLSGLPDTHWSRLWRLHVRTIRDARVGRTFKDHPTQPDTQSRVRHGNWGDSSTNGGADRG